MSKVTIFDPMMCCSTGNCGSSTDPEQLRIAAVMEGLKKAGIEVARYNLSSEPQAFMRNEKVSDALNKNGAKVLPMTIIDGIIVKSGSYLTNEELARLLDVTADEINTMASVTENQCGCNPKGCC